MSRVVLRAQPYDYIRALGSARVNSSSNLLTLSGPATAPTLQPIACNTSDYEQVSLDVHID